jgi:raffinose/stachyose/melibiose transport system substrate-binding protein
MSDIPRQPLRQARSRRRGRWAALAAALVAPSVLLAACSPGGGSADGGAGAAATSTSSTASGEPVTLVVQSGNGGSDALLKGYGALNDAFEKAHPGVTVEFTVKNFNDLVNTLKLQLSGSSVPDVTQVNQGYGSLGQLVGDQLVAPLDDAASNFGWATRQSDTLVALNGRFSPDGKAMGSGSLYGVSATGAWVGLFMNKEVAQKVGVTTPPATLAELEAALQKAKDAKVVPLQYGTSDGGEPIWLFGNLLMALGSPKLLTDVVNGADQQLPAETLAAARALKKWADAGYFTPGADAFTSTDVMGKFAKGQGLFALNGSWNVFASPTPAEAAKFTLVPFPTGTAGSSASIATGDLPWSVPTKAAHADLAAEYIDFISDPANNEIWIANGQVPASVSGSEDAAITANNIVGVSADAVSGWVALQKSGTPLPYPDWATPTFYDTIAKSAQSLAAGKMTPEKFVAALQADYGAFTAKRAGS